MFIQQCAKGTRLLDKKAFLFIQKKIMQVRAFERYISLNRFHGANLTLNSDVDQDT